MTGITYAIGLVTTGNLGTLDVDWVLAVNGPGSSCSLVCSLHLPSPASSLGVSSFCNPLISKNEPIFLSLVDFPLMLWLVLEESIMSLFAGFPMSSAPPSLDC